MDSYEIELLPRVTSEGLPYSHVLFGCLDVAHPLVNLSCLVVHPDITVAIGID